MRLPGAARLTVTGQAFVAGGDGPTSGHLALEARGTYEPWGDKPFGVDADATLLLWLQDELGPVAGVQQALRVDELRLRYGADRDPFVAFGRLRWAARTVGLLDGARLRSPAIGGFTFAAFGGFVPNVVTGRPATDASRFGAEITWTDAKSYARPRLSLTAYGSMFGGALDERRLALALDAAPGAIVLGTRAELAMFDADNPWGAPEVAVTSWGADATARAGGWHAGAHVDVRQPERSRFLASLLPQSWSCAARPGVTGPPEPCDGFQGYRTAGAMDAGWDSPRIAVSAGAAAIFDETGFAEQSVYGDVRLLRLFGRGRAAIAVTGVHGNFLDQMTLRVEAGATLLRDRLDVSVYWRGAQLSYLAATEDFLEHRVGADATFTVGPRLEVVLNLEGTTGPDVSGVVGLATCVWRPLP